MRATAKTPVLLSLIVGLMAVVVFASNDTAYRQASQLVLRASTVAVADAQAKAPGTGPAPLATISVARKGHATVTFTDNAAVAYELASVREQLARFETALGKDLARGRFRAKSTQHAVRSRPAVSYRTTQAELAATRHELNELEAALRRDIASGTFRAPRTRRTIGASERSSAVSTDAGLAEGVVSVCDELWELKMAFEADLHAGSLHAEETHFAIDGRRW